MDQKCSVGGICRTGIWRTDWQECSLQDRNMTDRLSGVEFTGLDSVGLTDRGGICRTVCTDQYWQGRNLQDNLTNEQNEMVTQCIKYLGSGCPLCRTLIDMVMQVYNLQIMSRPTQLYKTCLFLNDAFLQRCSFYIRLGIFIKMFVLHIPID